MLLYAGGVRHSFGLEIGVRTRRFSALDHCQLANPGKSRSVRLTTHLGQRQLVVSTAIVEVERSLVQCPG